MSNDRVEEGVRGYLKMTRYNKYMLAILNLAIWGSYLWDYTNIKETAGLFFVSLVINATLLKFAITQVKRESIATGYSTVSSSIFEILNKITEDLQRGSPEQRMEFRKKNATLCARLDATGAMTIYMVIVTVFWSYFLVQAML